KPKTNKYLVLDNSLFDFDKSSLGIKEIPSLDQFAEFLKKNPEKRVEITGHTDNRGSKTYNLQLSKKRSQSIADYLISRGINQTRLIVTGYGETMPVKANQNPDGSDNPEGRRLNRRTEVKTIE
ncbi:MAG TPA: OmpA family protein, partial [Flavobacteriales bacterium]|nr:OmpA family protein [Flavobacteriales bacterium]